MGIAPKCRGVEPNGREEFAHARVDLGVRAGLVDPHRIGDDVAHRPARIERRVGILKDELHLTTVRAKLASRKTRQFHPVELDVAGRDGEQLHETASQRRFAAPGLPHDAERLAALHFERDAVDRGVQGVRTLDSSFRRIVLDDVGRA